MYILKIIFGIFALIGAADRIFGNRLKLGNEFEKGVLSVGPLAVAMVGMITIAPTIARFLTPLLSPLSELLHIDLSFVGAFIANDMGGAPIAKELASSPMWGGYNGLVVASMMGVTISFTIPVALKTIDEKYHKEVLNGILCGIATIPTGCIVSGLLIGFSVLELIINLLPVIVISLITCIGLIVNPYLCRKIFAVVGNVVLTVITIGLGAGIFKHVTGITLIPYMESVSVGFATVSEIAVILAGVFPLIAVISKIFEKPFAKIGKLAKINDSAVLGIIASLANSIPMFDLVPKMNSKGIVMNMAFAVSASFVFGDHLAFTMTFDESFLPAVLIGKLAGGLSALIVAHFLCSIKEKKQKE